jgi:ectoine hydroxylase-related dioxygenase (phytanoyl-CoA dioxygenase family)
VAYGNWATATTVDTVTSLASDVQAIDAFRRLAQLATELGDYPLAERVEQRVLIYSGERLRAEVAAGNADAVRAELVRALLSGPGLFAIEGAFIDTTIVDRATDAFFAMIAEQRASGAVAGDHFAKPGANDRVWNALEKLAVNAPGDFLDYYANDIIALVASAWLGPGYQLTSQINVVNPGGQAQEPHCDYHLGFMANDVAAQFPAHAHALSPALSLQGAIAHCDMPLESGPTLYLPYSQLTPSPYLSWRLEGYREVFREHVVQLPLRKGDAAFFNPSVFHAAGTNHSTDIKRMANLLQINSAMGRALEAVDRARMIRAVYPTLLSRAADGQSATWLTNVIAATAEWYPFPTNLDRDPPVGGLVPPSQADLLGRAVNERWDTNRLNAELTAHIERRLTD